MRWGTLPPTPALVALAAVAAGMVAAIPFLPSPLRGIVGVALLVPLPGYAVTEALFPERSFDLAERIALALGLGLSAGIVGGLVLDVLPWGLTAATWALYLAAVTVAASAVTLRRRRGATVAAPRTWRMPRVGLEPGAMLIAAALLTVAALVVARAGADAQPHPGFTQLWMLPAGSASVSVGVRAEEGMPQRYTLELLADGTLLGPALPVSLADGESWQRTVGVPAAATGDAVEIEARLYRPGDAEPYRWTRVTLNGPTLTSP